MQFTAHHFFELKQDLDEQYPSHELDPGHVREYLAEIEYLPSVIPDEWILFLAIVGAGPITGSGWQIYGAPMNHTELDIAIPEDSLVVADHASGQFLFYQHGKLALWDHDSKRLDKLEVHVVEWFRQQLPGR